MKKLNEKATKVFVSLLNQIPAGEQGIVIHNKKTILPVAVQIVTTNVKLHSDIGYVVTLAETDETKDGPVHHSHYTFVVVDNRSKDYPVIEQITITPISRKIDNIDMDIVHMDRATGSCAYDRKQHDQAVQHCNAWLLTIALKQLITPAPIETALSWTLRLKRLRMANGIH